MSGDSIGVKNFKNDRENEVERDLFKHLKDCPIPPEQLLENLGLFLTSKNLSRILFMHSIYTQIIDVPGVVMDFGTRWGQNLALFATLRGIYEPFNRHRKLIGFDTFAGFPSISSRDGSSDLMKVGNISVTSEYPEYLRRIMQCHEDLSPLAHIKKFELILGDASVTVNEYLEANPETIVALAYFDFDLYEPTKVCLRAIRDRLVKGSILGFDELNDHDSPGETLALMECFGLNQIRLKRLPRASRVSYFVVE